MAYISCIRDNYNDLLALYCRGGLARALTVCSLGACALHWCARQEVFSPAACDTGLLLSSNATLVLQLWSATLVHSNVLAVLLCALGTSYLRTSVPPKFTLVVLGLVLLGSVTSIAYRARPGRAGRMPHWAHGLGVKPRTSHHVLSAGSRFHQSPRKLDHLAEVDHQYPPAPEVNPRFAAASLSSLFSFPHSLLNAPHAGSPGPHAVCWFNLR